MILEKKEIEFIKKNIDNAEMLIRNSDVDAILDEIDTFITVHGFDDNYDLTDIGRQAQRIYDNIYKNN